MNISITIFNRDIYESLNTHQNITFYFKARHKYLRYKGKIEDKYKSLIYVENVD